MKTKKFGKKLVLNKKTIAHLSDGELNAAKGKGGYPDITNTCFTCTCAPMQTCVKTCPITGDPYCEGCPQ